ncbi:hypothetical protein SUNI508_13977 [Seiridium unicorne]|uniref:Uncharacterized protein n=1 Tax=Seiridium unicorne TaxID=138068 RepID=A0ABR2V9S7_9PEZI
MDVSTDSDASEDTFVQPSTDSFRIQNVPACVAWRDPNGESQFLADLNLVLTYDADARKALVKLQTSTKLKKESAKPSIYLFIKPDQIRTAAFVGEKADDVEEEVDAEDRQHEHAQKQLKSNVYALRFELGSPAIFVVPGRLPYKFFRAGSQAVWKSWQTFARDTLRFVVYFPTRSPRKTQLVSFCKAASTNGALTSLDDNIPSLYGGKGGKIVDPHVNYDDSPEHEAGNTAVNTAVNTAAIPGNENDAPPAYDERDAAGPSISAVAPPLCLSPGKHALSIPPIEKSPANNDAKAREPPQVRKRRRCSSIPSLDEKPTVSGKRIVDSDMILQSISRLQQTIDEDRAAHGAILAKILTTVEKMEERISRLEEQQQSLTEEVETQAEPLWDELDARLQSQEDKEHDYMKDMVDEVFDAKIDEKIDEKIPDAVEQYLRTKDGQHVINEVVGERIHEETRDFLRSQRFAGQFTIAEN